jgi:RHS repeat-associated protein
LRRHSLPWLRCFTSQYTDAETGFQYLRARYYDPVTGVFLSRDPAVAVTGSAYGYVDGNPLNDTDSTGLCPWGMGELCHVVKHDVGRAVRAAQTPIAYIGAAASIVSAGAADVSAACAITFDPICAGIAKGVSTGAAVVNTAATIETTVYACQTGGAKSSACRAGIAATQASIWNTTLGFYVDPFSQAVLANVNMYVSLASLNSRLSGVNRAAGSSASADGLAHCPV